ncbi:ADP-ribosyltransferase [uncultured Lacinutrix sp.]|uniref:ADP-ribosyltransferase n=1 Tax=uncultured Lacinutrix sp. TaxID=574032 RepID=UPI0026266D9F|nr:ADP-ribosyltransferase [uncultured Lacinutrix sp.]
MILKFSNYINRKFKTPDFKNILFEYAFKQFVNRQVKIDFIPNKYNYFKDINGIEKWAYDYNHFFKLQTEKINSLRSTKDEEEEIRIYLYYSGYVSIQINDYLRNGPENIAFPRLVEENIELLSNSLSRFKLKNNLIVMRRFPKSKLIPKIKKGSSYIEKGFISTTLNLSSRLDFECNYKPFKNDCIMILKVPKGTNACYVEEISKKGEYELIIQKGQEIQIERHIKLMSNVLIVGSLVS